VRKNQHHFRNHDWDYLLILSGDQLYRMDFRKILQQHEESGAEITLATIPVPRNDAKSLGIMQINAERRITRFVEKPKDPEVQKNFISRPHDEERPFLGSMGIYLFKTKALIDLLTRFPDYDDFGGDIIPEAIKSLNVFGYNFDGYWEDIGTIRSYYETNLKLTCPNPPFNFYDPKAPIYTHARFLPGSIVEDSQLKDVLLAEGSRIRQAEITHSIVGIRSQISEGVVIKDSIIIGADYYVPKRNPDVPIGIGRNCYIESAILDKNVQIGEGVVIRSFENSPDRDHELYFVRDGVVVIAKDTVIPPGTCIEPK